MPVKLQMCDYDTRQHPSAKLRSANREVRTSAGLLKPDTGGERIGRDGVAGNPRGSNANIKNRGTRN